MRGSTAAMLTDAQNSLEAAWTTKSDADIDIAVGKLKSMLQQMVSTKDERYLNVLPSLASALLLRWEARRRPTDLDEAIDTLELAIQDKNAGMTFQHYENLYNAGTAHLDRWENVRRGPSDLLKAIETWEMANKVALSIGEGFLSASNVLPRLGDACRYAYDAGISNLTALHLAVGHYTKALHALQNDPVTCPKIQYKLGKVHATLYQKENTITNLQSASLCLQQVLTSEMAMSKEEREENTTGISALYEQAYRNKNEKERIHLDSAIWWARRALEINEYSDPRLHRRLAGLLITQFKDFQDNVALDLALESYKEAWDLRDVIEDKDVATFYYNYGTALMRRSSAGYTNLREQTEDLRRAVELLQMAVDEESEDPLAYKIQLKLAQERYKNCLPFSTREGATSGHTRAASHSNLQGSASSAPRHHRQSSSETRQEGWDRRLDDTDAHPRRREEGVGAPPMRTAARIDGEPTAWQKKEAMRHQTLPSLVGKSSVTPRASSSNLRNRPPSHSDPLGQGLWDHYSVQHLAVQEPRMKTPPPGKSSILESTPQQSPHSDELGFLSKVLEPPGFDKSTTRDDGAAERLLADTMRAQLLSTKEGGLSPRRLGFDHESSQTKANLPVQAERHMSEDSTRSQWQNPSRENSRSDYESGSSASHTSSDDTIKPTNLTGRIIRTEQFPIDEGGFSSIYRGEFGTTKVAIKVIRSLTNVDAATLRKRLRREMFVWWRLDHQNIVPLLGFVDDMGVFPSMVSPWYEQGNASSYVQNSELSVDFRLQLLREVSAGLKYLHLNTPSIVHGDLKPGNILIDNDGIAQLCDFGLAHLVSADAELTLTSTGNVGTIRYAAPELRCPENDEDIMRASTETDIYSLSCIAYEFVYKKPPFADRLSIQTIIAAGYSHIPPARKGVEDVSILGPTTDFFWDLLETCWDESPLMRPDITSFCDQVELIFLSISG